MTVLDIPTLVVVAVLCQGGWITGQTEPINLVGLFDGASSYTGADAPPREDRGAKDAFQRAISYTTFDRYLALNLSLSGLTIETNPHSAFQLTQQICEDLRNVRVAATLGVRHPSLGDYMMELSHMKHIPYFELMPSSDYSREMVFHMHPAADELVNLLQDIIKEWRWQEVLLVYEDQSALNTYLKLLARKPTDSIINRISVQSLQLNSSADYMPTLQYIRRIGTYHVIVDCQLGTITPFLTKALEMQMLTPDYHYHFTSLDVHVLDLSHFSYGGANITWSQLVNKSKMAESPGVSFYDTFLTLKGLSEPAARTFYFTTYNALIVDSLILFAKALTRMKSQAPFTMQSVDCDDDDSKWQSGFGLKNYIKNEREENGVTGNLQFDLMSNRRVNYSLSLMGLQAGGSARSYGVYRQENSTTKGQLFITPEQTGQTKPVNKKSYYGRTLYITTVAIAPFFMNKSNHGDKPLSGNDRYEGFIVDLMAKIAQHLPIVYEFHLVGDGQYGVELPNGSWNGMVEEVRSERADLAVAPLTINYDREQVIDFTKPFMTFGIAILYKKPEKEPPDILSFMEPINGMVWGTIIASVVVVSFSMYLFSRFSPNEWENPFPCNDEYEFMENQFSMSNAFWFSVGSIMQQGSDIMPKAPSTRIVAIAWWLFTLIIISSYTANLAAFLTITTLSETFTDVESLAAQSDAKYGCMASGNTCRFFENSKIPTYKKMWEYMSSSPEVLAPSNDNGIDRVRQGGYAYLMESPSLQYETVTDPECELRQVGSPINSLSYGIGIRENETFRDDLSYVILRMNEDQDLLTFYNKWWRVDDNRCDLVEAGDTDLKLRLPNLEGIFVFLMGGLALGGIILCIEILMFTVHRSKKEKQPLSKIMGIWLKNSIKGKFPNTVSLDTIETMSLQENATNGNKSPHITGTILEEAEPLNNGHVDRVPASTTTDTFI